MQPVAHPCTGDVATEPKIARLRFPGFSLTLSCLWDRENLIDSFFAGVRVCSQVSCYVTSRGKKKNKNTTLSVPQPSAAQFMSNLQTFNIAASQFIKSNSARAKSLGNGFRITRGVTGSS